MSMEITSDPVVSEINGLPPWQETKLLIRLEAELSTATVTGVAFCRSDTLDFRGRLSLSLLVTEKASVLVEEL